MSLGNLPLRVGIVGCGDASERYADTLRTAENVVLCGATDRHIDRLAAFISKWGGTAYSSIDDLIGDDCVDIALNLTRHRDHADVTARCLRAGKHVYSEKPLAIAYEDARALAALATARGLRLACAPTPQLGESQRRAREHIDSGALGKIRLIYAEANFGMIEKWHPRPHAFLDVGPVYDVGVYPLTLITAFCGPALEVDASGAILLAQREDSNGTRFTLTSPDCVIATIRLCSGALVRLTCNFYVEMTCKQNGIEFHGDDGSLYIDSLFRYDAALAAAARGRPYRSIVKAPQGPSTVDFARGIDDLAMSIVNGQPHTASAEQAAHVVEIVEAIMQSANEQRTIRLESSFAPHPHSPPRTAGDR